VLLWVCAATQIFASGYMVLCCIYMLHLSPDQLRDIADKAGATLPAGDPLMLQRAMLAFVVLVGAIGLLPGLIYGLCAFGVRAGGRRVAGFCVWLATAQFVILGMIAAVCCVFSRGPAYLLLGVALWSVLLVPLALAMRALRRARG
jgi:hypothetical protein